MDSPLLKYSAKDYFFKAALCHFCIDMLNAKVSPDQPSHLSKLPLFVTRPNHFSMLEASFSAWPLPFVYDGKLFGINVIHPGDPA